MALAAAGWPPGNYNRGDLTGITNYMYAAKAPVAVAKGAAAGADAPFETEE